LRGSFVLDASLVLAWCFSDEQDPLATHVLLLLKETYALAPALLPFEIVSGLVVAARRSRITADDQQQFLDMLYKLPIAIEQRPFSWLCQQILPLAIRYGLTPYDAAYLELAHRENLPLATLDNDLRNAAAIMGIPLVECS
jgi:predicted nucleic acid-binding protein